MGSLGTDFRYCRHPLFMDAIISAPPPDARFLASSTENLVRPAPTPLEQRRSSGEEEIVIESFQPRGAGRGRALPSPDSTVFQNPLRPRWSSGEEGISKCPRKMAGSVFWPALHGVFPLAAEEPHLRARVTPASRDFAVDITRNCDCAATSVDVRVIEGRWLDSSRDESTLVSALHRLPL